MKNTNGPKRIRELLQKPGIIRSLGARDVEIEPGEHVLSSPLRRAVTPANPNRAR